ncbi:MAG: radical SAM protein [Lachnospiraceae bacterium]|nr:radical SAM protein [Lachnospiraceae bacterium]
MGEKAVKTDAKCMICPRKCGIERYVGRKGFCGETGEIRVTRAMPHMWEEPVISGKRGSGAVFFSGCNLHCVYCQNKAISDGGQGKVISINRLKEIFLELQDKKVYNINLVTPTHYTYEIIEAVALARNEGLKLPIVYNCGGYESVESIRALKDTVDIWMPDMKYISSETAKRYSNAPDYFEVACNALKEMTAQVNAKGGTKFYTVEPEADGNIQDTGIRIMERGVIVRHMLLPGHVAESKRLLRYLHETYGNDIYISIMSQYTPMPQILESDRFPELKTKVLKDEYDRLVDFAVRIGIENAFIQEGDTAEESFIPAFDCEGV